MWFPKIRNRPKFRWIFEIVANLCQSYNQIFLIFLELRTTPNNFENTITYIAQVLVIFYCFRRSNNKHTSNLFLSAAKTNCLASRMHPVLIVNNRHINLANRMYLLVCYLSHQYDPPFKILTPPQDSWPSSFIAYLEFRT